MTMNSEQWAARHFDQVTEPSLLSQAFSFISRSIFDPFKNSHMRFAESVRLDESAIADARTYMQRFPRPKEGNANIGGVPTDESVLKTNPGIEIDFTKLVG
ncbi:unnamed protein product [Toxocara canis]|uniref:Cytochrome P450 n=1 Tax=Toxocara canis TaxID=6265 RepID=A0A183VGC5_TOXCA|nr:unnamed protein product [Toxocara canis]